MGLFERFPYTNFHELNAEWLLKKMKELTETVNQFIATESLKFADPIIWDITTQYQKSTIVLDPTGNAYLSVQIVPAGIQLNNDEYWLEIFNFTDYTRTANSNLTVNVETNTTRATASYAVDDWLIWEDVLYKVTSPINIDNLLVVGTNLVHFTVEDFIKAFITYASGLIQQYKNDIDASELAYRQQLAQDITNTTQSLQIQLDQAIAGATVDSEVIDARIGWNNTVYTTLGIAIRSQMSQALKSSMLNINSGNVASHPTLGNLDVNTITFVTYNAISGLTDSPFTSGSFYVLTFAFTVAASPFGGEMQLAIHTSTFATKMRFHDGANWSAWMDQPALDINQLLHSNNIIVSNAAQLASYPDADNYPNNTIVLVSYTQSANVAHTPYTDCSYTLITTGWYNGTTPYGGTLQIAIPFDTVQKPEIKIRSYGSSYTNWFTVGTGKIEFNANPSNFVSVIASAVNTANATVHLAYGTYNLFDAVHDEAYWKANRPTTRYTGLLLGNGVRLIADGEVVFNARYTGSDSDIMENFSVFNITGNCTIEGVKVEAENICYIVHDDAGIVNTQLVHAKYVNCNFRHYGSSHTFMYGAPTCFGGGIPNGYGTHEIDSCILQNANYPYPISYHTSNNTNGIVKVLNTVLKSGTIRFSKFTGGTFTGIVTNCKIKSAIVTDAAVDTYEWNNVIY